jgi:hypothetical protein
MLLRAAASALLPMPGHTGEIQRIRRAEHRHVGLRLLVGNSAGNRQRGGARQVVQGRAAAVQIEDQIGPRHQLAFDEMGDDFRH